MLRFYHFVVWLTGWIFLCPLMIGQNADIPEEIHIGIIKYKTEEAVLGTYQPLFQFLADELKTTAKVELVMEEDLGFLLDKGDYDIGIFPPFPYLKAKADFPDLEIFASHTIEGKNSYKGCIVVRKADPINNLADLKNQRFTFVKNTSTSGYKFPKGIFTERSFDAERGFFSDFDFSGSHEVSLQALLTNETDGIAIDEKALDDLSPSQRGKLKVLKTYDIPYHAYVFSPKLSPQQKRVVREMIWNAHRVPATRGLFSSNRLGIDKWHQQTDEAYNSMRRYLRIERVRPTLQITYTFSEKTRQALQNQDDLLQILERSITAALQKSGRFLSVGKVNPVANIRIVLELSITQGQYHAALKRGEEYIEEKNFTDKDLLEDLPVFVREELLKVLDIQTQLLYTGEKWFVPYGHGDGLNREDYEFHLATDRNSVLKIADMDILNTTFEEREGFREGIDIVIHYKGESGRSVFSSTSGNLGAEESFWDNRDNQWGVIGLLVAFLTIALGSYFSTRKKKRFKNLLYECNDLLKQYLEGSEQIDTLILNKKEKINQSLEKGIIREDQFLILMHRLNDIDYVISAYMEKQPALPANISQEINSMISDDIITESEYTRIVSLIKSNARNNAS